MADFKDFEVIGVESDGKLIQWDAGTKTPYVSGDTLEEFGVHNLTEQEIDRLRSMGVQIP